MQVYQTAILGLQLSCENKHRLEFTGVYNYINPSTKEMKPVYQDKTKNFYLVKESYESFISEWIIVEKEALNIYEETIIPSSVECLTKNDDSPNPETPCHFPFTYEGITYFECTEKKWDQLWCSTEVDNSGNFVSGKWGNCGNGCEAGKKFSNLSKLAKLQILV